MCIYVHCTGGLGKEIIDPFFFISGKQLSSLQKTVNQICQCYRPFGCGIILGGYDRDGPQLYMIEPSGISYVSWIAFILAIYSLALFHIIFSIDLLMIAITWFLLGNYLMVVLFGVSYKLISCFKWKQNLVQRYFGAAIGKGKQAAKT